jgi:hypothetical protein
VTEPGAGAYGLRIAGLPGASDLLVPAPDSWLDWRFERVAGELAAGGATHIDGERAIIPLDGGGTLEVDRARATATLTASDPLADRVLVHPYLGAVAALVSRWRGAPSFHGGGLVVDGAVWGLLGERSRGKSTLLAWLASLGVDVLSDDLLVLRSGRALAGPRCVDLREDAAEATGLGENIGVVGGRVRWRVLLGRVLPEAPLAGWVVLDWGDEVAVRPRPAAGRLPTLLENVTVIPAPPDPATLLDLSALPMLELVRPRDFASLADSGEALLAALRRAGPQAG